MFLIRYSPLFVRDKLQKQHSMILLVLILASSCIVFYYFTVAVCNLQDASHHSMRTCICPFLRYKDSQMTPCLTLFRPGFFYRLKVQGGGGSSGTPPALMISGTIKASFASRLKNPCTIYTENKVI